MTLTRPFSQDYSSREKIFIFRRCTLYLFFLIYKEFASNYEKCIFLFLGSTRQWDIIYAVHASVTHLSLKNCCSWQSNTLLGDLTQVTVCWGRVDLWPRSNVPGGSHFTLPDCAPAAAGLSKCLDFCEGYLTPAWLQGISQKLISGKSRCRQSGDTTDKFWHQTASKVFTTRYTLLWSMPRHWFTSGLIKVSQNRK